MLPDGRIWKCSLFRERPGLGSKFWISAARAAFLTLAAVAGETGAAFRPASLASAPNPL